MKNEIIILDIETTGFSPSSDILLELGITKLNLKTGARTPLFDKTFCEPELGARHRDAWIFKNGYMSPDEVRGQGTFRESKSEIQEILNPFKDYIYAWNSDFDRGFLRFRGIDMGVNTPCPMKDSTNFFKLPKPNSTVGYKYPKAQEAWNILFPDKPRTEMHRGYDDSDFEAIIIHKLVELGEFKLFRHLNH